jgi:hypothetical protein
VLVFEDEAQIKSRSGTSHCRDSLSANGLAADEHWTIIGVRHVAPCDDFRVRVNSPWAPDQHRIGTFISPDYFTQMRIVHRLSSERLGANVQSEDGP